MVCNCCKSLDLGRLLNAETVPHHSNFKELQACYSTEDCPLCAWVIEGLEDDFQREGLESSCYDEAEVCCYVPPYSLDARDDVETWRGISEVVFKVDGLPKCWVKVELFVARGNID